MDDQAARLVVTLIFLPPVLLFIIGCIFNSKKLNELESKFRVGDKAKYNNQEVLITDFKPAKNNMIGDTSVEYEIDNNKWINAKILERV